LRDKTSCWSEDNLRILRKRFKLALEIGSTTQINGVVVNADLAVVKAKQT
jgi:hypothetical protein